MHNKHRRIFCYLAETRLIAFLQGIKLAHAKLSILAACVDIEDGRDFYVYKKAMEIEL